MATVSTLVAAARQRIENLAVEEVLDAAGRCDPESLDNSRFSLQWLSAVVYVQQT